VGSSHGIVRWQEEIGQGRFFRELSVSSYEYSGLKDMLPRSVRGEGAWKVDGFPPFKLASFPLYIVCIIYGCFNS
jgi:hypothetical protein